MFAREENERLCRERKVMKKMPKKKDGDREEVYKKRNETG